MSEKKKNGANSLKIDTDHSGPRLKRFMTAIILLASIASRGSR
jgi:hypothetical protein